MSGRITVQEEKMKCRDCAEGKPIGGNGILCIQYGIIIGADHECTLKGGRLRERDADHGEDGGGEAELSENSGGAA